MYDNNDNKVNVNISIIYEEPVTCRRSNLSIEDVENYNKSLFLYVLKSSYYNNLKKYLETFTYLLSKLRIRYYRNRDYSYYFKNNCKQSKSRDKKTMQKLLKKKDKLDKKDNKGLYSFHKFLGF